MSSKRYGIYFAIAQVTNINVKAVSLECKIKVKYTSLVDIASSIWKGVLN